MALPKVQVYIDGVLRDDVESLGFSVRDAGRRILTGTTETISPTEWSLQLHHLCVLVGGDNG